MKLYGLAGVCAIAYFLTLALGDWVLLGWIGFCSSSPSCPTPTWATPDSAVGPGPPIPGGRRS
jgi:hypothetical protein